MSQPGVDRCAFDALDLASVDLVRSSGAWSVIEVNAVPVGLLASDRLVSPTSRNRIQSIARVLAARAGSRWVCVALGRRFELSSDQGAECVRAPVRPPAHDRLSARIIEDANEISAEVRRQGGRCVILSAGALVFTDSQGVQTPDGREIGCVLDYSCRLDSLHVSLGINSWRTAMICWDKALLTEALLLAGAGEGHPPCVLESDSAWRCGGSWVVRKPRFGGGSRGISLVSAVEATGARGAAADMVVQPWVKPDTLRVGRRDYFFDCCVLVVAGEAVGALIRHSVAPCDGVARNGDLAWLPTLGPAYDIAWAASRGVSAASARDALGVAAAAVQHVRAASCLMSPVRVVGAFSEQGEENGLVQLLPSSQGSGSSSHG